MTNFPTLDIGIIIHLVFSVTFPKYSAIFPIICKDLKTNTSIHQELKIWFMSNAPWLEHFKEIQQFLFSGLRYKRKTPPKKKHKCTITKELQSSS